jgi:hypothetical protein
VTTGVVLLLVLWAIAPILLYWILLRCCRDRHFFAVGSVVMFLGPLAFLLGGIFGPMENSLGIFFVPALQWILAIPLGVWFAFIVQSRTSGKNGT